MVLATTRPSLSSFSASKPHFLVYGHYDVQPPDPLELWKNPPFEPRVTRQAVYARGASDNKGQHFVYLKAVEAYLKTHTELPCEITFLIEGEEEIGSPHLSDVIKRLRRSLQAHLILASDTTMPGPNVPGITYALRGIAALEVIFHGPSQDLHSGIFGGCVDNPAMALCQTLAKFRDEHGRITIPGFYDKVQPLSPKERRLLRRLPNGPSKLRQILGVPKLFGEAGFTPWEQRTARPTFEINGLTAGYQGEGSKTIIPSWAKAKISVRTVPNQRSDEIQKLVAKYIRLWAPPTVKVEIRPAHGAEPYYLDPDSPWISTAAAVLRQVFRKAPYLLREGGSIPIVPLLSKILGAPVLLIGLASPDDNAHSPNEKFNLTTLARGSELVARLLPALSQQALAGKIH